MISAADLIRKIKETFGPLSEKDKTIIASFPADTVECIAFDLKLFHTKTELERNISYWNGREIGQVEGMRNAVFAVIEGYDDDAFTELDDQASACNDMDEMEVLLKKAIMLSSGQSLN